MVKVPKAEPGKDFVGLDMLTKLLAPAGGTRASGPLIEVLDGTCICMEFVIDM